MPRIGTRGLAVLAVCLLAGCAGHRAPPPSTEIDEAGFRDRVRTLASEEFEGRRPGTPGEDKTVAYLVEQFRKFGLKPGNGTSFLQSVPVTEITADRGATLTVTGRGATHSFAYDRDAVLWTRRPVAETGLERSDLVFAGYGIVAPEYDWNDYAGLDVHGKTVVVLANDPGYGSKDPKLFKGNAATYYGLWRYKAAEAARQGAAGVLLIHDAAASGYSWDAVRNSWEGPRLVLRNAASTPAARTAVEGWLSAASARALFAQAALDLDALSAAAARPGFKAVPLGLTADVRLTSALRELNSSNVVAWLPGAHRHHEYVLYTAHWDHLGRADAALGGAVREGAVDDAAGVAGLLMIARSLSRTQPPADRSIVFIAFTAAESGLLGSAYYVDHPVFPLRDTVAALDLDMLRIGGPTRDVAVFGYGNSEMDEFVHSAALLQGREVRPEPAPEQGWFYRSDEFSFARRGVPVVYAKGGVDDSARGPAWGKARLEDYLANRYRQPADRYEEDWDVRGTLDDLRLYEDIGSRLAHSRRFPRWYPQSDYRTGRGAVARAGED